MAVIEPAEFTSKKRKKIFVRSAQKDDVQSVLEVMTEIVKTSPFALHCGKVIGTCEFVNSMTKKITSRQSRYFSSKRFPKRGDW